MNDRQGVGDRRTCAELARPPRLRHPSEDFAEDGQHFDHHIAAVVATGTPDDPQSYGQTMPSYRGLPLTTHTDCRTPAWCTLK
ncbi:hypothetical protein GCM10009610_65980 [Pseudonocardia xinjiangensis]